MNPAVAGDLPIIDIAPLMEDSTSVHALRSAEAMRDACLRAGCFYIKDHGLSPEERTRLFEEVKRFFDLPEQAKMKLHISKAKQFRGWVSLGGEVTHGKRDWHECLDLQPKWMDGTGLLAAPAALDAHHPLDDVEQWPESLPSFRIEMMRAWDHLYGLSKKLVEGLALGLGLPRQYFEPFEGPSLCSLRLSHYPPYTPAPADDDIEAGFGAHCDYGFLTVLQQDEAGGLEVKNPAGDWIAAPHVPDAALVLIGMMMQRWTNDRYTATLHRVLLPKGRNRYSIPFFFEPAYDAVIEPLPVCCSADNPPRYESYVFGEHVMNLFSKAYGKESEAS